MNKTEERTDTELDLMLETVCDMQVIIVKHRHIWKLCLESQRKRSCDKTAEWLVVKRCPSCGGMKGRAVCTEHMEKMVHRAHKFYGQCSPQGGGCGFFGFWETVSVDHL